ncbi:Hypothetical predicted protein [Cloeon dipterum]|uniref:Uncharacterized protein n=1 Tax=Cloeon dipterum TaxID=197152 RepID=A0A8S1EAB9_9INSE|nr:Hypothetical predicted protein [Cloeon dipterum]
MPFFQRLLRSETDHCKNVPVATLKLTFAVHRLFTFPLRLFRDYSFDLLRMVAEEGFYYDDKLGFLRSIFCEMTISAEELAEISSHELKVAKKIISERLLQFNCKIGDYDNSRNVPMRNIDDVPNYKFEAHRLFSLLKNVVHFPHVNIYELAKCGFYYLGGKDKVKCDFCTLEIHGWEQQDNPDEEHLRWNPKCPFMLKDINVTASNIPIGSEQIDSIKTDAIGSMANVTANPHFAHHDVPANGAAGGQDEIPQQAPQMLELQPAGDPVEAQLPQPDVPQQNPAGN